jgi:hypothetical protein
MPHGNFYKNELTKLYFLDVNSITQIGGDTGDDYSQGVLEVKGDYVVCWKSSLLSPPSLVIAKIQPDSEINWIPLFNSEPAPFADNYKLDILRLEAPSQQEVCQYCLDN